MTKTLTQILSSKQIRTKHRGDDNSNFFLYNHDIFSAAVFQSKLNISNYELMNEVCIVFFPCLYIKAKKKHVQLSLKSHKLRHVSTTEQDNL